MPGLEICIVLTASAGQYTKDASLAAEAAKSLKLNAYLFLAVSMQRAC